MGKTENTTEPETLKKQTQVLEMHAVGPGAHVQSDQQANQSAQRRR
jgi:hypothetical protein